jgi:hypothetical protein
MKLTMRNDAVKTCMVTIRDTFANRRFRNPRCNCALRPAATRLA